MGSGKSAVGRRLAERLGWPLADTDALVEARAGASIETIFRERGEGAFRALEWEVLQTLSGDPACVVATGGGLYAGAAQRAFLRAHATSCWLDVPLAVSAARLAREGVRPVWDALDPVGRRILFERRRAAYALADLAVRAGDADADDVAARVESAWRALCR